jgi:hypothetical protein
MGIKKTLFSFIGNNYLEPETLFILKGFYTKKSRHVAPEKRRGCTMSSTPPLILLFELLFFQKSELSKQN